MDEIKLNVLRGVNVQAKYVKSPLVHYRGNPLIEALPGITDLDKTVSKLSNTVSLRESDRKKNATLRAHYVFQLTRFVEPMDKHLQIEQALSIIIRDGYVDRNPLTVNGVRIIREGADNVRREMNSQNAKLTYNYKTSGSGLTIIGVSGMGKTTAINNILLKMYPAQIIRHGLYKERHLNRTQIVWMKLETPPSGSIKGLCLNFFQTLDELLGKPHYYPMYRKKNFSTEQLIPEIAQLCATYCIGALVIDEIQHLHDLNVGGQDLMLNFFVALKNVIGIPIILIGTLKAWNFLTREFREARRAVEYFGMVRWDRMGNPERKVENDIPSEWDRFLSALWNYQWTKQSALLDEEMLNTMYDYSQGITDVAIKLFMAAQWRAISDGDELITPKLIESVAKIELRGLYPVIQAFRHGDEATLEKALDVFHKDYEVEQHFSSVLSEIATKLKNNTQVKEKANEGDQGNLTAKAISWLVEAGTLPEVAEGIVKKVQETKSNLLLPELKLLSFQMLLETKKNVEKKVHKKITRKPTGKRSNKKNEVGEEVQNQLMSDVRPAGQI